MALFQATAAGTGHMKKEDRNQWVNNLLKVIRAGQPKRPTTERDIAALGIRVEHG
jgi:hypothetical protein